ncbi:hypothetical protein D3C87_2129250 [compost metagenome]
MRLDLVVGIEKRIMQAPRHRAAHGGLAGAHQADEKEVGSIGFRSLGVRSIGIAPILGLALCRRACR